MAVPFSEIDVAGTAWREAAARQSSALVLGSFTCTGELVEANAGLHRLLNLEQQPYDIERFRSPPLRSFLAAPPQAEPVYAGLLTIHDGQGVGSTIRGVIFRHQHGLHLIAEHDVSELAAVNDQMHELNREVTRLHRESARQTRELQSALRQLQESQAARETLHRELLAASRRAGRAEVAVGVLHNVGNALNGVTVSATLVADGVRASQMTAVKKICGVLEQHRDDLPAFVGSPQGQQMLPYLQALANTLQDERQKLLDSLTQLLKQVGELGALVDAHRKYGQQTTVNEAVNLPLLLDELWPLLLETQRGDGVELARGTTSEAVAFTDGFRLRGLLQDLVAAGAAVARSRNVTTRLAVMTDEAPRPSVRIVIERVTLTPAEIQELVRQRNDHAGGLSLHDAANVCTELNGKLLVTSDPAHGTTLTLRFQPAPPTSSAGENVAKSRPRADSELPTTNLEGSAP